MSSFRAFVLAGACLTLLNGCCALSLFREGDAQPRAAKPASSPKSDLSRIAKTTQTAEGLQVDLSGDFLFATGRSELSGTAKSKIAEIAAVLKKDGNNRVTVVGHTDSVGNDANNQALSEARAAAVKSELVAQGLSASRVTSMGRGETQPIASNDTAEGRAKNRRTEIKIQNR